MYKITYCQYLHGEKTLEKYYIIKIILYTSAICYVNNIQARQSVYITFYSVVYKCQI